MSMKKCRHVAALIKKNPLLKEILQADFSDDSVTIRIEFDPAEAIQDGSKFALNIRKKEM